MCSMLRNLWIDKFAAQNAVNSEKNRRIFESSYVYTPVYIHIFIHFRMNIHSVGVPGMFSYHYNVIEGIEQNHR